jgi:uncharacterized protein
LKNNNYLSSAKEIILNNINKEELTVFLFGSRATNNYRPGSDLDVGFYSEKPIDDFLLNRISRALSESRVPYHYDLVDFSKVDESFKTIALENYIIWNKGKNSIIK